jgi:multisubunit Na+/H+ antiporter MnhB subunit
MMGSMLGILGALLFGIIPIAVIILIIVAVSRSRKNTTNVEPESFEKIIRTIYLYLLLIILLFSIVFSVITAFSTAVDYFLPYESQSNYYNLTNQKLVEFITSVSLLVISLPLFIYHNRLVKKLK